MLPGLRGVTPDSASGILEEVGDLGLSIRSKLTTWTIRGNYGDIFQVLSKFKIVHFNGRTLLAWGLQPHAGINAHRKRYKIGG
jgi:hypothetical protein